jgi:hypothetical protein
MNMKIARRAAIALLLLTAAWPSVAADYFWNCTTPDGIKYADASKCDKGDSAVKVMKSDHSTTAQSAMVPASSDNETPNGTHTAGACPADPAYCKRPQYGVTEGSPRTQAIMQFMRERECDFMQRFPARCIRPN